MAETRSKEATIERESPGIRAACHTRQLLRRGGWAIAAFSVFQVGATQAPPPKVEPRSDAPLPVEALLDAALLASRAPVSLTPDGRWLAYVVYRTSRRREGIPDPQHVFFTPRGVSQQVVGSTVWVSSLEPGRSRALIENASTSWGPSWSPDGRLLAFYSDAEGEPLLTVWDRDRNRMRSIPGARVRPFFPFETPAWAPDNRMVVVKIARVPDASAASVHPTKPTSPGPGQTRESMRSPVVLVSPSTAAAQAPDGTDSMRAPYAADLAIVDVERRTVRRLVKDVYPIGYVVSPDGAWLAYSDFTGRRSPNGGGVTFDVKVVSVATGTTAMSVPDVPMGYGIQMAWSRSSNALAIITSGVGIKGDCLIADLTSRSVRNATAHLQVNFASSDRNIYRTPAWDPDGRALLVIGDEQVWQIPAVGEPRQITRDSACRALEVITSRSRGSTPLGRDGSTVMVACVETATERAGFRRIRVDTGEVTARLEGDFAFGGPIPFRSDIDARGESIVFSRQSAADPEDLWTADGDLGHARRLTDLNPQIQRYPRGTSRLVDWKAADGTTSQGVLLLPANYQPGRRYPLVVDVYGEGNTAAYLNTFGLRSRTANNGQLLASRGYAVLVPDVPLKRGSPMRSIASTVLAGVDRAIALGIADPDRLGVTGNSYGGYAVLALIVQTDRFRAAIARSSFASLFGMYGVLADDGNGVWTYWAEQGQGNMGGPPWALRDQYLDNSPLFFLDRVSTPLLLVHGGADRAVPPFLAEEVYVWLRRAGKRVTYVKYPGGDHSQEEFSHDAATDYANRVIAWFDQYLR